MAAADPDEGDRAVVPARRGRAFRVRCGQHLKLINTHGTQVVDTWALVLPDLDEELSMSHTRFELASLRLEVGDQLYSGRRRPILTMVEDTSPGIHDLLYPACDPRRYELLGHSGHHDNCCENFRRALAELGYERDRVPDPLNLFMNVRSAADGSLALAPAVGRPGDSVTLRAEDDLVLVLSTCPQDLIPINGPLMRPMEVEVEFLG
jgi:uncharacterized protein YcgI (DUF1989 family)